jgi:adenosylhomocysteine nucleosidase
MFRSLLQTWLHNAAGEKIRREVLHAAAEQVAGAAADNPSADARPTCQLGVIFALGIESGGLEDLLDGATTVTAGGLKLREGTLDGQNVAIILSGPGRQNAARAVEILPDGHRPRRIVAAGLAGGLDPQLRRNDILVADHLLSIDGGEIHLELPPGLLAAIARPGVRRGALLTADNVVRSPAEKRTLFERYAAAAVDMETFAAAEVCQRRQVPFSAVRVINDPCDETLPRDVERLLRQTSGAARLGAAFAAALNRPASVKDMYQLRENALVASDRLAKFLAEAVVH